MKLFFSALIVLATIALYSFSLKQFTSVKPLSLPFQYNKNYLCDSRSDCISPIKPSVPKGVCMPGRKICNPN